MFQDGGALGPLADWLGVRAADGCHSVVGMNVSIRDLIAVLALGTIAYRLAIADGNRLLKAGT